MSLDKIKIQTKARKFISHFDPKAKIGFDFDGESSLINIETEISGALIGRQGEVLEALQHILRLVLAQEMIDQRPLLLDVGGYRALRLKELEELAKKLAQDVLDFGGQKEIGPLNAYERRIIHLVLRDIDGAESSSIGEEPERRVVIRKSRIANRGYSNIAL